MLRPSPIQALHRLGFVSFNQIKNTPRASIFTQKGEDKLVDKSLQPGGLFFPDKRSYCQTVRLFSTTIQSDKNIDSIAEVANHITASLPSNQSSQAGIVSSILPGNPKTEENNQQQSAQSTQSTAKPRVNAKFFKYLLTAFEFVVYSSLFLYAAQYSAYYADNKYALKCFGNTSEKLEKVLDAIRLGNDTGNPVGFIPSIPTRKDMYDLLFEVNGHMNMQFLIHAFRLNDNADYFSNNLLGMYQANRMSQCMDLMTEHMHLILSAALQLGYLTASDYENFEKTGNWQLPCIYYIPPSSTTDNKPTRNWFNIW